MSGLVFPAPVWRRVGALVYDGLLLCALWMSATLLMLLVLRNALETDVSPLLMQPVLFAIGLFFFSGFWTRGGQTLGMRAWRLQVRRLDGGPLRWPIAALRYVAGLVPLIASLWAYKHVGPPALALTLLVYLPCLLDGSRRALNDWVAGTEVVVLPARQSFK
jgi:uncharacterized RDD family membrane protein YckC